MGLLGGRHDGEGRRGNGDEDDAEVDASPVCEGPTHLGLLTSSVASSTVTVVCKEGRGGGGGEAAAEEEARQHGRIELGGCRRLLSGLELSEPPLPELRPKRVMPLIQEGREHQPLPTSATTLPPQHLLPRCHNHHLQLRLPRHHHHLRLLLSLAAACCCFGKGGDEGEILRSHSRLLRPPVAAGKETDPAKRQILQRGRGEEEAQIHGARGTEGCLGIGTSSYGIHGAAPFLPPWCYSVRDQQSLRTISPPRVIVVRPRKRSKGHRGPKAATTMAPTHSFPMVSAPLPPFVDYAYAVAGSIEFSRG
uniref:Uncharacterized protein n=1 Tax=Oryza glumipatula TaxID=40148 RepID=A0A0D9ZAH1_9ORYZ